MSRSDAFIWVECDNCHERIEVQLTAIAGNGWDERNVDAHLKSEGWHKEEGDIDICDTCAEETE